MTYRNSNYLLSWLTILLCLFINTNAQDKQNKSTDKVSGCLVGGALGDACGAPTEFIGSLEEIKKKYPSAGITGIGSLKDSDFNTDKNDERVVPYTDDTGMTLPLFKVLLEEQKKGSDLNTTMAALARSLVTDMEDAHGWSKPTRAPGNACMKGVKKLKNKIEQKQTSDPEWWAVGESKAGGCGSVMRAHPCGIVFAYDPKKAEEYAVAQSKLTHGDPIALAASAAQAVGIAAALQDKEPIEVVQDMIAVAQKYSKETANRMRDALKQALAKKDLFKSVDEAITGSQGLYSKYEGWAAHDAIAATIYTFILYPDDLKAAIRLGANTPGDSDSIASMAGALVGARTGFKGQLTKENLQIKRDGQVIPLEGLDYIKELAQEFINTKKQNQKTSVAG